MPDLECFHYAAKSSEVDRRPLLLFHGSGGSEIDLMEFADQGADVSSHVLATGHGLHETEVHIVANWILRKEL